MIRIVLEQSALNLRSTFAHAIAGIATTWIWQSLVAVNEFERSCDAKSASTCLAFFADRLKVQLREQGARHDLVDAVFALEGQDDLC